MTKRHTPPKFLPPDVKKEWNAKYDAALQTAKINYPDDERQQHAAANKAANVLLTVPAPQTHADAVAMPAWQVTKQATKLIDGTEHLVTVTIDGRKYKHPVPEPAVKAAKDGGAKKESPKA